MTDEILAKAQDLKTKIKEMEITIRDNRQNIMYLSTNAVGSKPYVVPPEMKDKILTALEDELVSLKGEYETL